MNRSILIVIADFLLVSLLVFSSFDASKLAKPRMEGEIKPKQMPDLVSANQDMLGVLKQALTDEERAREELAKALAEEQRLREQLAGALTEEQSVREQLARQLSQTQASIREQQALLAEQERQARAFEQNLRLKDQQTAQLERERDTLMDQFSRASTNLLSLQQQLKEATSSVGISKEQLSALEARLRKEQSQSAAAQQRLAQLETARKELELEKQQLSQKLQVTETEKQLASAKLTTLQGEIQAVRSEKAQLVQHADNLATTFAETTEKLSQTSEKVADSVKTLAKSSGDLTKEIREHRPLPANVIFAQFATNRVQAQFEAYRSGLLGMDVNKYRETETILVSDGNSIFAICHVDDTPLNFWSPGTDWERLTGRLNRRGLQFPIDRVSFYLLDPRIIMVPVSQAQAQRLGGRIYPISPDPFRFPEAVLIGAKEGYYGECKFQIDLSTPQYVKMDRSFFRGLFGRFNPSRGDLVFSKMGELLGIMANSSYCIVIHNFKPAATFQFGESVPPQNTGDVLSRFHMQINALPIKLR